ncbi:polysaccharide export protein [Altererythrobacter salegens]|uniref:Polysaccharide export protein n=1 Tax=Croceibacterium salegens TaxID=1737568 RepID=A0A6I4SYR1_9SPHN|nr:polysaccharide biosynthesis/export family protein [Croceibacterium salegens]MXO60568.1 polysaccharide export protein [Croceibacterium salegens]
MRKLFLFLPFLLAACVSEPSIRDVGKVPLVQDRPLPEPTQADQLTLTRPYLIGPFDKLSIDVFGVEELSRDEVQVDAGGRVSLPLAGNLEAAGLSPGELETAIRQRLRRYVRDPQVTVNLKETISQVVTVDGQVSKPGPYPVIGKMTLIKAVATAGGTSEFAKLDDVVVFRTVGGQRMAGLYNLGAIRAGAYDDPEIFANDIVIVGDSQSRRLFSEVLKAAPLLTTPLLILFNNRN